MADVHTIVAFGVARRLGIPVVVDESAEDAWWDGSVLRLSPTGRDQLTHEIAHWLVARAHGELARVDFGCTNPWTPGGKLRHRVPFDDFLGEATANKREEEADTVEKILDAVIDAAVRELAGVPEVARG